MYISTFHRQVIQTFVPCLFGEETSVHEILGIRITSFLMENFCEIFKVCANMNASALRCLNRLQYNIPHKMHAQDSAVHSIATTLRE